ncbi:MAG: class I SAM-dependent methyltransferase [Solirubrobacterales bacterium]
MANRVHSLEGNDPEGFASYEAKGAFARDQLLALLPRDFGLEGKRVLDFGCGAGRTLRHFLAEAESGEFWGADIDGRSIEWLEENLCPPLNVLRAGIDPPLPFESESFDFAWAISVFTHLAGNSAEWLLELHRVLKPGGFLMASYMGEWNSEEIAGEAWDENRIGMNTLFHDRPWDEGGPMVLMSDWWVREHWGRAFELVVASPWVHNQCWLMMRKKEVSITAAELLEPGPDAREAVALRHNLEQIRREVENLGRHIGEEGDRTRAIRVAYENSLSWRITRPVRSIGSFFRR